MHRSVGAIWAAGCEFCLIKQDVFQHIYTLSNKVAGGFALDFVVYFSTTAEPILPWLRVNTLMNVQQVSICY